MRYLNVVFSSLACSLLTHFLFLLANDESGGCVRLPPGETVHGDLLTLHLHAGPDCVRPPLLLQQRNTDSGMTSLNVIDPKKIIFTKEIEMYYI